MYLRFRVGIYLGGLQSNVLDTQDLLIVCLCLESVGTNLVGLQSSDECMESLVCSVESLDSFLLQSNKYIACLFSAVSSQICQPFVQDEREARHRKLSSAMEETTRNGSGQCTATRRVPDSSVPYKAQLDWCSLLVARFVKFLASGIKSSQCRRFHRPSHRRFHRRPQHRPFERLEIT